MFVLIVYVMILYSLHNSVTAIFCDIIVITVISIIIIG